MVVGGFVIAGLFFDAVSNHKMVAFDSDGEVKALGFFLTAGYVRACNIRVTHNSHTDRDFIIPNTIYIVYIKL